MADFLAGVDWQAVMNIAFVALTALGWFLLYKSVPPQVFDKIRQEMQTIKDLIPGTVDDMIIEAVLDALEDEIVDEDSIDNA